MQEFCAFAVTLKQKSRNSAAAKHLVETKVRRYCKSFIRHPMSVVHLGKEPYQKKDQASCTFANLGCRKYSLSMRSVAVSKLSLLLLVIIVGPLYLDRKSV